MKLLPSLAQSLSQVQQRVESQQPSIRTTTPTIAAKREPRRGGSETVSIASMLPSVRLLRQQSDDQGELRNQSAAHQLFDLGDAIGDVVDDEGRPEGAVLVQPLAALHPHELGILHHPPAPASIPSRC
jgi:hypothetical protein